MDILDIYNWYISWHIIFDKFDKDTNCKLATFIKVDIWANTCKHHFEYKNGCHGTESKNDIDNAVYIVDIKPHSIPLFKMQIKSHTKHRQNWRGVFQQ